MVANSFAARCLGVAALLTGAQAVTTFTDAQLDAYLSSGGTDLAYAYAPVFFFSQSQNKVPTYPTWAFSGSPDTADVYDSAHQTVPAPQCDYPDVGCNSRNPGVATGNQGPRFPLYFTTKKCSDTEVRVAYNLYYQKDGAKVLFVETGHEHDWERVIVIHTRDASSTWMPTRALYSAHSGYHSYDWNDIQNTLTTEDAEAGKGPEPNGLQGLDHPKAYVSWSKHAHFHDRNTGWNDAISQSTDNAFRGQDWWKFVEKRDLIQSDIETAAGKALDAADWGSATRSGGAAGLLLTLMKVVIPPVFEKRELDDEGTELYRLTPADLRAREIGEEWLGEELMRSRIYVPREFRAYRRYNSAAALHTTSSHLSLQSCHRLPACHRTRPAQSSHLLQGLGAN
ncbi:hypothetical protein V494_03313 [Pseudogymnoascus sp. VKM F-4513 (FW-928)]|nr:hypothetical protein V494_03313 [Pseudogymnoascus sp. VKM F-4513 (FW-928)]